MQSSIKKGGFFYGAVASGTAKTDFITENAAVCGDFADECRDPFRIYPRICGGEPPCGME